MFGYKVIHLGGKYDDVTASLVTSYKQSNRWTYDVAYLELQNRLSCGRTPSLDIPSVP